MKHLIFTGKIQKTYKIALLIKTSAFSDSLIRQYYIDPLIKKGVKPEEIIALSLTYSDTNKATVTLQKESLKTILKACEKLQVETLFVADANYFKTLTKQRKAEPHFGYVKDCEIPKHDNFKVILTVNFQALFHNPMMQQRLDMSIDTLVNHLTKSYVPPGKNIIKSSYYPKRTVDIKQAIQDLHKHKILTCDIETFSLELHIAGVASIAFAWNQHEGLAFLVDLGPTDEIREALRQFFKEYKGKLIFHNGNFDIKILIYNLFMQYKDDIKGMHSGLNAMYRDIEDTKLITYLATNSAQGNNLSLKHNAFEFSGNYALEEISDVRSILKEELLIYNLIDALSTWYVYNKYWNKMVNDCQLEVYNTIFKPSMRVITHMELIGMPMDLSQINKAKYEVLQVIRSNKRELANNPIVKNVETQLAKERMVKKNLLLKTKVKPLEDFYEPFNPGSTKQVQALLYDHLGLPVLDQTDTGAPAVGGKTLEKLFKNIMTEHNLTEEDLK